MSSYDEHEEVGYGHPPQTSRFRKGKSGNPKGRPKGSKNTLKILEELLSQKILITQDGRQIKISKKAAMLLQAVNSAVKGDAKSLKVLLPHMLASDANNEKKESEKLLPENDRAIIDQFLKNYENRGENNE